MSSHFGSNMFWGSFWLYLTSFALFVVYAAIRVRLLGWIAAAALFVGFLPHTVGLVDRWILLRHLPMNTMYEYANLMSWMFVVMFGFFLQRTRRLVLGVVISPALVMIMVATSILGRGPETQEYLRIRGSWLTIHVTLTALAEAAFALGFACSVAYLFSARRARHSAATTERAPARLQILEDYAIRAIVIGYPLFIVGALFAGSIWALEASGSLWGWSLEETAALLIWLAYSGYLYAQAISHWRGPRLAWLSIVGFALVLFSFVGDLTRGGHAGS